MKKEKEEVLMALIGKKNFSKIEQFAFRWACIEAEHLGIYQEARVAFNVMCSLRRNQKLTQAYEGILSSPFQKDYEFKFASDEDIREEVKNIYNGNRKNHKVI